MAQAHHQRWHHDFWRRNSCKPLTVSPVWLVTQNLFISQPRAFMCIILNSLPIPDKPLAHAGMPCFIYVSSSGLVLCPSFHIHHVHQHEGSLQRSSNISNILFLSPEHVVQVHVVFRRMFDERWANIPGRLHHGDICLTHIDITRSSCTCFPLFLT